MYQLLQPIVTKSVDIVWHCPSSLRCSLWQLKVRLFENDYVAIVWDVMMNLWLSNVPPSSSTILLSKMHPQLKVEFHTLMNPIKEVKPLWRIQGSMDQRVLPGVLPTEKKQVTMDAATACSLGFALIGAWLLGYRPGFFVCEVFQFLGKLAESDFGTIGTPGYLLELFESNHYINQKHIILQYYIIDLMNGRRTIANSMR